MKSADSGKAPGSRALHGRSVLASALRLWFFLATVCALASAFLLRSVRADVGEVLWGVGAEVMRYPDAPHEPVRQLQLNGIRVSFRTQTVDAPVEDVLAHYEALCGTTIAMQSARGDSDGYVACLDMGDGPQDLGMLANRVLRFAKNGDLQEVGDLRYVRARRVMSSSGDKTFLLTMWADSAVNLYRMLPRAGADAVGRDLDGVPRPPGSQRILSAWEARQPSGVVIYRVVAKSAEELESFYRIELPRNGWRIIERHPSESIEIDGIHMISAGKDHRLVTVLSRTGETSHTVLTILASEPS